jgi:hypothetical protein
MILRQGHNCAHKKEEEEDDDALKALQKGLKYIQEPLYYISSIVGLCCRYDASGRKMKEKVKQVQASGKVGFASEH